MPVTVLSVSYRPRCCRGHHGPGARGEHARAEAAVVVLGGGLGLGPGYDG